MKRRSGLRSWPLALTLALLALWRLSAEAEDLADYSGAALYQRFCASCHGKGAQGDGPVAPTLRIMVPDLTRIARRHGGQFPRDQVNRIIDGREVQPPHGSRTMPVWGYEFQTASSGEAHQAPADLIQRLTDYLESIQVK